MVAIDTGALNRLSPTSLSAATNKTGVTPSHPLFRAVADALDSRAAAEHATAARRAAFLARALGEVDGHLAELRRTRRVQTYNGILSDVHRALRGPQGAALAAALRQDYPVALVDEFQDTSALQAEIFEGVYRADADAALFQVGDPKQSIYEFRGADVHEYLRASRAADSRFRLPTNWRSTPETVDQLNALFGGAERPFLTPNIEFRPVEAATKSEVSRLGLSLDSPARELSGVGIHRFPVGTKIDPKVALALAAEHVATLVKLGRQGHLHVGERSVDGGDVAVIVRTNDQVEFLAEQLSAHGVTSVAAARTSVLDSDEARFLEMVLAAVLSPADGDLVRAALLTPLLGWHEHRVRGLLSDNQAWAQVFETFVDWQQQWRQQGVATVVLAVAERARTRRRLTNLRHLAELLARQEAETGSGSPRRLFEWLTRARQKRPRDSEEDPQRLEDDASLVRLMTVHGSKGLEYPIVFCPVLGLFSSPRMGEGVVFHERASGEARLALRPTEEQLRLAKWEAVAEEMRLAYVALTRARNRAYVYVFEEPGMTGFGPLTYLLTGGDPAGDFYAQRKAWKKPRDTSDALDAGIARSGLDNALREFAVAPSVPGRADVEVAAAPRTFRGELDDRWRVTSFTALGTHRASEVVGTVPNRHDAFGFPAGAQAGICLHAILEATDFSLHTSDDIERIAALTLVQHGFDAHWAPVARQMIDNLRNRPLPGAGRLRELSGLDRIDEMAFTFPVQDLDPASLFEILGRDAVAAERIRGHLTGFIDLVFRAGDRYFLADYKSNWLGTKLSDYAPGRLAVSIRDHDYDLQYHLYALALHRWLRHRIVNYCYDEHCGGVFYFYLRGIAAPPDDRSGVFFDRPSAGRIAALDKLFTSTTKSAA